MNGNQFKQDHHSDMYLPMSVADDVNLQGALNR